MPPLPPASTIGHLARRRRAGRQLGQRPRPPPLGDVLDAVALEDLEALGAGQRLVARSACRCRRWPRTTTLKRVRIWSSWASRPSELAIRTRRRLSPQPTCTWVMASPAARAASSARVEQLELAGLVHRVGRRAVAPPVRRRAGRARRCAPRRRPGGPRPRRPGPRPAGRPRSGRRCGRSRWSRRRRPGSRRRARGPRRAPRPGGRRAWRWPSTASSANTSAMSPPPTKAVGQHTFEHVRVDEGGVGHGGIVIVVPADPSPPPHRGRARAARRAERPARADRRRRGHGRALPLGRRPRARHAPPASRCARRPPAGPPTGISPRRSPAWPPGCSSTTWRPSPSARSCWPRPRWSRSRAGG